MYELRACTLTERMHKSRKTGKLAREPNQNWRGAPVSSAGSLQVTNVEVY